MIAALFDLAANQQITLSRGEYRMQADDAGGFLRYRISLPVKGQAAAIQGFVEQGLLRNRSLAFESVQFKRDKIESANVEARIQWTLVVSAEGLAMIRTRHMVMSIALLATLAAIYFAPPGQDDTI